MRGIQLQFIILIAVAFLAACSGPRVKLDKCHKPQEYREAKIGPEVVMPEGLEPLDPELILEIPVRPDEYEVTPVGQPCLVDPPSYLDRDSN